MRSTLPEVRPGAITQSLSSEEASQCAAQWLEIFGGRRHGVNTKAYLWHVFSSECYPSTEGAAALAEYGAQVADEYVVLSNDRKCAFLTDLRPEYCPLVDYYVFPPNLAWTMAFTHEDGWLGPYFARHPDFKSLNEANARRIEKKRQVAFAKQKGWA